VERARFPDNDDLAILAAEAVIDTRPWDYWEGDNRTPRPGMDKAIELTEAVLARNPGHIQAAHVYIHLMEASDGARRAEPAADRLAATAPPAGHLLHMPAHIYYRLGRYADSLRVNIAAVENDRAYIAESGDEGLFRYGYYPHDVHFMVASAQLAGNMKVAVREARALSQLLDPTVATDIGWIQLIHAAPYFAFAQFAPPRETLALGASPLPFVQAMRHFSRATAFARMKDRAGFSAEIAAMRPLAVRNGCAEITRQGVPGPVLLRHAQAGAQGKMAFATHDYAGAAGHYS